MSKKKCDCIEPYFHDFESDGIWQCDCPRSKQKETYKIEDILKQIEEAQNDDD